MKNGKLIYKNPELKEIAKYSKKELDSMWEEVKRIENPHKYYVDLSKKLWILKNNMLNNMCVLNPSEGIVNLLTNFSAILPTISDSTSIATIQITGNIFTITKNASLVNPPNAVPIFSISITITVIKQIILP